MGIWEGELRSSPAIFTDQGEIDRVILVSECLEAMVGSSLLMKKLNENSSTKFFQQRLIITINVDKQRNKILTANTPVLLGNWMSVIKNFSLWFSSSFYIWLVREAMLISDPGGFQFKPNYLYANQMTMIKLVGEDVLICNPSGFQFGPEFWSNNRKTMASMLWI